MSPQNPRSSRPNRAHGGRPSGGHTRRPRERQVKGESLVGRRFEVEVGKVAHGGFAVARHEGRAVFVRHAIPGERVVVEVTDGGSGDRFLRADAVEVIEASEHRVEAPCRYAGPGGCGGCDWQHVDLAHQRELKAQVVIEQLDRLAGLEIEPGTLQVEPVPGDEQGLRWRTRLDLAVDAQGTPGLHPHRSNDVIAIDDCLIATEKIARSGALERTWPGTETVVVADAAAPEEAVLVSVPRGRKAETVVVGERVPVRVPDAGQVTYGFDVAATGFWQAHVGAPSTLVEAVLEMAAPEPGLRVLDLYCGVGLFTVPLADAVKGDGGEVLGVEGDEVAVDCVREVLDDREDVEVVQGDVTRVLAELRRERAVFDLVVLDPPRSGAGAQVVDAIVAMDPQAVVYVACDPAALARDVATFEQSGYQLVDIRAFDTFPMTQHVECVALLVPAEDDDEDDAQA